MDDGGHVSGARAASAAPESDDGDSDDAAADELQGLLGARRARLPPLPPAPPPPSPPPRPPPSSLSSRRATSEYFERPKASLGHQRRQYQRLPLEDIPPAIPEWSSTGGDNESSSARRVSPPSSPSSPSSLPSSAKRELTAYELTALTAAMAGVQVCYSAQIGHGSARLETLGLRTELLSLAWLAGPLSGIIVQPIVGIASDHCTHRLGRRRPFLIVGALLVAAAFTLLGNAPSIGRLVGDRTLVDAVSGQERVGSRAALSVAILAFFMLDFSIQAIQGPLRALLTDVVPESQQSTGNARFALMVGVGNLCGSALGSVDLTHWRVVRAVFGSGDGPRVLFYLAALILLATVAWCAYTVREVPLGVEHAHTVYQERRRRECPSRLRQVQRQQQRPDRHRTSSAPPTPPPPASSVRGMSERHSAGQLTIEFDAEAAEGGSGGAVGGGELTRSSTAISDGANTGQRSGRSTPRTSLDGRFTRSSTTLSSAAPPPPLPPPPAAPQRRLPVSVSQPHLDAALFSHASTPRATSASSRSLSPQRASTATTAAATTAPQCGARGARTIVLPAPSLADIFTLLIRAPRPFWRVFAVQCFTWTGFFSIFVYATVWVAQCVYRGIADAPKGSARQLLYLEGVYAGNAGLAYQAMLSVAYSFALPHLLHRLGTLPVYALAQLVEGAVLVGARQLASMPPVEAVSPRDALAPLPPPPPPSAPLRRRAALALLALLGVPWATTMTVPWTLIGTAVARVDRARIGMYSTFFNLSQSMPQLVVSLASPMLLRVFHGDVSGVMACSGVFAFVAAALIYALRVDKFA